MNNKTKQILAIAGAVILVAAIILTAIFTSSGRGSEKGTLTQFYTAMYSEEGGGMDAIVDCLIPQNQQEFYNTVTLGGTSFSQLSAWRMEAVQLVGDQIDVQVEIMDSLDESSSDLKLVQMNYPNAQRYRVVSFKLTLTGSDGSEDFVGVMPLVQMDGTWYMASNDAGLKRVVPETAE